jgi:hypothetical protein
MTIQRETKELSEELNVAYTIYFYLAPGIHLKILPARI